MTSITNCGILISVFKLSFPMTNPSVCVYVLSEKG